MRLITLIYPGECKTTLKLTSALTNIVLVSLQCARSGAFSLFDSVCQATNLNDQLVARGWNRTADGGLFKAAYRIAEVV